MNLTTGKESLVPFSLGFIKSNSKQDSMWFVIIQGLNLKGAGGGGFIVQRLTLVDRSGSVISVPFVFA